MPTMEADGPESSATTIARRDLFRGAAGLATIGSVAGAPAVLGKGSPNDRLGIACVGVGNRGHYLLQLAQDTDKNAEVRILCDLYEGNLRRAKQTCTNPKARVIREWEKAVADPDIDVVIIASPDFWHPPMTIAAAAAKKDMYVEKGWCNKLEDAKKMRQAVKDSRVVMQLGHHYNGKACYHRAREIFLSGELGKVPVVRTYTDRTTYGPRFWKFYTSAWAPEMPKDAGPDTIDWERFIANAPKRPFDAERFFTWRCYWDYGTGMSGDLMSHLWDGVNMVMGLGIPAAVLTQGGLYFWTGDREVPDTWNVVCEYPARELAVSFASTLHSTHVGEITQFFGREKTLEVSVAGDICRTFVNELKPEHRQRAAEARKRGDPSGLKRPGAILPPDYSMKADELKVTSHMEDFFACVRSRKLPRCHVDRAFEEAVTIVMSVESYFQERKVKWDPVLERIV